MLLLDNAQTIFGKTAKKLIAEYGPQIKQYSIRYEEIANDHDLDYYDCAVFLMCLKDTMHEWTMDNVLNNVTKLNTMIFMETGWSAHFMGQVFENLYLCDIFSPTGKDIIHELLKGKNKDWIEGFLAGLNHCNRHITKKEKLIIDWLIYYWFYEILGDTEGYDFYTKTGE